MVPGTAADRSERDACRRDGSPGWYDGAYDADNKQALAEAQKLGMQVNDVVDLDQFRKAVQPVYQNTPIASAGWR